jgi:hypothetical protein
VEGGFAIRFAAILKPEMLVLSACFMRGSEDDILLTGQGHVDGCAGAVACGEGPFWPMFIICSAWNTRCSLDASLCAILKERVTPCSLANDPLHVKDVSHMQGSTAWGCQW